MWKGRKFTNLIVIEVIETLKWEVFLLYLLDHFLWKFLELPQRRHRLPPVKNEDKKLTPCLGKTPHISLKKNSAELTFSCQSSCRDSWSCL